MRTGARAFGPWVVLLLVWASPTRGQHVERLEELMARAGMTVPRAPAETRSVTGGWEERALAARASGRRIEGSLPVLLVPGLFQDSPEPVIDTDGLRRVYFQGPSTPGTLPEFYIEASAGRFTVTGEVASWHRTGVTRDSATGGPENVLGIGPGLGDYLIEALAAADAELDFGQFDNDGPDGVPNSGDDNGFVDYLAFFFTEAPRSCGGSGVWPHFFGISPRNGGRPYESDDTRPDGTPILADAYLIVSAAECDGSPGERIAIIAHELGHALGLPDLYHPIGEGLEAFLSQNRRWVVGCFGLMAAGAWGCGPADQFPSFGPTHLSAWSRERVGWADVRVVPPDSRRTEYFLAPAWSTGQILQIPLAGGEDGESLLVEYRPAEGFDASLPGSGVLVYRVDGRGFLRPDPAGPKRYHVSLVEADGDSTLVRNHGNGGNRGEASDIFAWNGEVATLSNLTTPSTRLFEGDATPVTLHRIEIVEGEARIVVSTHPVPALVAEGGILTVRALEPAPAVPIGGGVPPYLVQFDGGDLPAGLAAPAALATDGVESDIHLGGAATVLGSFPLQVTIRDGAGTVAPSSITLVVKLIVAPELLIEGFLAPGGTTLDGARRQLLDSEGNGNGRYDAGDLRAHLFGG